MQLNLIISIVNLIAIITLFILFFTKNNKENFTGAPAGYTNLLVSDPDGNLDTFSMNTLETDIDTKIDTKISSAVNSLDAKIQQELKNYATNASLTNVVRKRDPINITYGDPQYQWGCRTLMGDASGGTIVAKHGAKPGVGDCTFDPGKGPDGKPLWINEWMII